MEIALGDIKHIIIDMVGPYSLNVIVYYFIFGSVNVPNTDKTPAIFAFGVHAKAILQLRIRCEYGGGKSGAFCVSGP